MCGSKSTKRSPLQPPYTPLIGSPGEAPEHPSETVTIHHEGPPLESRLVSLSPTRLQSQEVTRGPFHQTQPSCTRGWTSVPSAWSPSSGSSGVHYRTSSRPSTPSKLRKDLGHNSATPTPLLIKSGSGGIGIPLGLSSLSSPHLEQSTPTPPPIPFESFASERTVCRGRIRAGLVQEAIRL